jgi:protein TonB
MAHDGFLEQKPRSPFSLVIVVALHGAAIAALMLAKMEYERLPTVITNAYDVKPDEPPPPVKPDPVEPKQRTVESRLDIVKPVINPPVFNDVVTPQPRTDQPVTFDIAPIGPTVDVPPALPKPEPKPEPVRTEAQIDGRSRLQPNYPPSEERASVEGSVTILVTIGVDGRVKAVERIRAANDAFYRATEQQALRHWRFKPATVDGKPVESRKTMTVHFKLDA